MKVRLSRFNYMNSLAKKGFNSSLAVFRVLQELRYWDSIVSSTCYSILATSIFNIFFLDFREDEKNKLRRLFLHRKPLKPGLVLIAFQKETRRKMQHVLVEVRKLQRHLDVKIDKVGLSFDAIALELSLSHVKKVLPLRCRSCVLSTRADIPTAQLDIPQATKSGKRWRRAIRGFVELCTCCLRQ